MCRRCAMQCSCCWCCSANACMRKPANRQYNLGWLSVVQYSQCGAVQSVWCSTVSLVQYSRVQYGAVQLERQGTTTGHGRRERRQRAGQLCFVDFYSWICNALQLQGSTVVIRHCRCYVPQLGW
jgi:hypothetical protein